MRILKAFIVSTLASGVAMIATAVFLGIFNIYLAGHGIDWPNESFETGLTGMSPLSTLLAVVVIAVFLGVFILTFWSLKKKSPAAGSATGDSHN